MTTILANAYTGATSYSVTVPYQPHGYLGIIFAHGNNSIVNSDGTWTFNVGSNAEPQVEIWSRVFDAPTIPGDSPATVTLTSNARDGIGDKITAIALSIAYGQGYNVRGTSITPGLREHFIGTSPPTTFDPYSSGVGASGVDDITLVGFSSAWVVGVTGLSFVSDSPLIELAEIGQAVNGNLPGFPSPGPAAGIDRLEVAYQISPWGVVNAGDRTIQFSYSGSSSQYRTRESGWVISRVRNTEPLPGGWNVGSIKTPA